MNLKHVALMCSTEENADRFFVDLMGFKKSTPKILPRGISRALFGVDSDLKIVNYQNGSTVLEIFIHAVGATPPAPIEHLCFEVGDRDAFLTRCRDQGVEIRQVPKGEKIITFIADYDGHLFELI